MRTGRYSFTARAPTARWPFAVHEVRMTPMIAPEFQASFQRIITTTRYHFHIEEQNLRERGRRAMSRR